MNDERTVFPASAVLGAGVKLENTGMVNTGPGTFLEIQLIPSGTVIKLSENTSLIYNGMDRNSVDLGLLYGRIRVVTRAASPTVINCGGVSARVEEGDIGIDYFLDPGNVSFALRPLFRLYTFRGIAEVFPFGKGGTTAYFGSYSALGVTDGWSISIDVSSSLSFAERKPLDGDIKDYWRRHNFAGIPPQTGPSTLIAEAPVLAGVSPTTVIYVQVPSADLPVAPAVPAAPINAPQGERRIVGNASKQICLFLGMFLMLGSVGVQGYSYFLYDIYNDDFAKTLYRASYPTLGLGAVLILIGTLYNPKVVYL
jgi:hypothetical protein